MGPLWVTGEQPLVSAGRRRRRRRRNAQPGVPSLLARVGSGDAGTAMHHFISMATFRAFIIKDLGLLLLVLFFGSKFRSKLFTPWLWGGDGEATATKLGGGRFLCGGRDQGAQHQQGQPNRARGRLGEDQGVLLHVRVKWAAFGTAPSTSSSPCCRCGTLAPRTRLR